MASPLASLYTNKTGITQLAYPSDLGSPKRGHWINFTISVPEKSTYTAQPVVIPLPPLNFDSILNGQLIKRYAGMASNVIDGMINGTNGGSMVNPPSGSGGANNAPLMLGNNNSSWQYTVMPGTTKIVSIISLYTPDTISSAQHSHYVAESMTEAMGGAGQAVSGITSLVDMANDNASFSDTLKTFGVEQVAGTLGNDILTAAGLKASGSAINPQMEVFFKDIDFRTFQFDFLFTPKSSAEATTVQAIIQAFKFHAAPEIDLGKSGGGRYYIVPSVFEIQMYKDGQPNLNVNKYGICACETVNVDYAPQGWVTHDDGMPVQTRLTLQFKEMEILTKEKITLGY